PRGGPVAWIPGHDLDRLELPLPDRLRVARRIQNRDLPAVVRLLCVVRRIPELDDGCRDPVCDVVRQVGGVQGLAADGGGRARGGTASVEPATAGDEAAEDPDCDDQRRRRGREDYSAAQLVTGTGAAMERRPCRVDQFAAGREPVARRLRESSSEDRVEG